MWEGEKNGKEEFSSPDTRHRRDSEISPQTKLKNTNLLKKGLERLLRFGATKR